MSKKALEVTLLGESYKLVTDDSDEHVFHAARLVDTLIHHIEYAGVKDSKKTTILAALQLASKLIKLEQDYLILHTNLNRMQNWVESQVVKLSEVL